MTNLTKTASLIIIGGSAVVIAYAGDCYTRDIDTYNQIDHIKPAYLRAKEKTQLDIPLNPSSVADAPYRFEERLQEYCTEFLQKLKIFIPEKHDLVLMKVLRAEDQDIQHIKEIEANYPLDYTTLLSRFLHEMSHVVINCHRLEMNFLYVIEQLWGEERAEQTEAYINTTDSWLTKRKQEESQ